MEQCSLLRLSILKFLLNVEKKGDVITHSEVFMPQAIEDYKQDNM